MCIRYFHMFKQKYQVQFLYMSKRSEKCSEGRFSSTCSPACSQLMTLHPVSWKKGKPLKIFQSPATIAPQLKASVPTYFCPELLGKATPYLDTGAYPLSLKHHFRSSLSWNHQSPISWSIAARRPASCFLLYFKQARCLLHPATAGFLCSSKGLSLLSS